MSNAVIGLLACGVTSLFFGSMFVPVRKFKPGDGIVVQFIMCSAIFTVGLLLYFFRGFPQFQPFAMLGGMGWAIGNLTAMPIIDAIGLGLGVLIWGSVNCVVGWAVGRFGLFGTHASVPDHILINYVGLICVIIGGALFSQIKPSTNSTPSNVVEEETAQTEPSSVAVVQAEAEQHLLTNEQGGQESAEQPVVVSSVRVVEETVHTDSSQLKKKIIGVGLSIFAGLCYGTTFVPTVYIQDNPEKFVNPSKHAIDYVFSNFVGIYLTSISVLIIYIIYKRNQPYVDHQIIGPSLLAGLMWAIAQMSWFVANDSLSQAITFPINAMVPGVIATIWSVFFFKEIKGKRNMQMLVIAIAITLMGAALVGFSK